MSNQIRRFNFTDNSTPLRGRRFIRRGIPLRNVNRQNMQINNNHRIFNPNSRIIRRKNINNVNNNVFQRKFYTRRNYFNNRINNRLLPRNNFNFRKRRNFFYRKLYISNLDPSISNNQLNELFSVVGELVNCYIHYDNMGNSLGTANVEYKYPESARRAVQELNGAQIAKYFIRVNYDRFQNNFNPQFNNFRINNRNPKFTRFNLIQQKNNNNRRMVFRRKNI